MSNVDKMVDEVVEESLKTFTNIKSIGHKEIAMLLKANGESGNGLLGSYYKSFKGAKGHRFAVVVKDDRGGYNYGIVYVYLGEKGLLAEWEIGDHAPVDDVKVAMKAANKAK